MPEAMPGAAARAPAAERLALRTDGAATVGELLEAVAGVLHAAGIAEPRVEARDLLAALHEQPRFWPSTHRALLLDGEIVARAERAVARRAAGAPFAYAVGRAAFRHLTLDVDERVLIPRQETEVLVEEVLARCSDRPGGVCVDVGTGSGCIALALACEGRFDRVVGTDVSLDALNVARANAAHLGRALCAPVEFRHGSLLAPVRASDPPLVARCIVSNPPYIAYAEAAALPPSVRDWEPPLALYAPNEGMAIIAALVREAAELLEPDGLLALEVDARRAALAAELAATDGRYAEVAVRLDLAGRERFVLAVRR